MDEFNASGGTRRRIEKILSSVGKKVLCYFSIADFNPSDSVNGTTENYCLYDLQYYLPDKPQANTL